MEPFLFLKKSHNVKDISDTFQKSVCSFLSVCKENKIVYKKQLITAFERSMQSDFHFCDQSTAFYCIFMFLLL